MDERRRETDRESAQGSSGNSERERVNERERVALMRAINYQAMYLYSEMLDSMHVMLLT